MLGRGTLNDVIHIKVELLAESHYFLQHPASNRIETPSFTVPITHLMKQHGKVVVTDDTKFNHYRKVSAIQDEKATPAQSLTGCYQALCIEFQNKWTHRARRDMHRRLHLQSRSNHLAGHADSTMNILMTTKPIDIIKCKRSETLKLVNLLFIRTFSSKP